jgi:hypothetical protein
MSIILTLRREAKFAQNHTRDLRDLVMIRCDLYGFYVTFNT